MLSRLGIPQTPWEITVAFMVVVTLGSFYAQHHQSGFFVPLVILTIGVLLRRHTIEPELSLDDEWRLFQLEDS